MTPPPPTADRRPPTADPSAVASAKADPLRILEVAALPFPSRQGTQVALDSVCRGLAERGHDVHLLVYAHGAFPLRAPYTIHRLPDSPRFRSLRSGPDWRRALLDLRLALELRRLARVLRPDVVHLHNVEAAAAALLLPFRPDAPCVYHAHNLMEHELPIYGTLGPPALARRLGRWLDAQLPARADLALAISAPTRDGLLRAGADPSRVRVVEPGADLEDLAGPPAPRLAGAGEPATVIARPSSDAVRDAFERAVATPRARADVPDVLGVAHLGNLDRYQGLDTLLSAVARVRDRDRVAELVVISDSSPEALGARAARLRVPIRFVPHESLANALCVLGDCRVAALARNVPGGFPMKLIALLAAGIPVAATQTAVRGLDVEAAVVAARDDSPAALAAAIVTAADDGRGADRVAAGLRLARTHFSRAAAAERLETALRGRRR
ncbi:MAG: glycosyltransferase family 4 protein [Deltaproteobacteria bacterium]|nr:glycosyltransferase family 4 protein [Deltaproteobacteria bacterium]